MTSNKLEKLLHLVGINSFEPPECHTLFRFCSFELSMSIPKIQPC